MSGLCQECGKPTPQPHNKYCSSCFRTQGHGQGRGPSPGRTGQPPRTSLPADYLKEGYFDERGNLFERYLIRGGDADLLAKACGNERPSLTNTQLRRFFGHVRACENQLRSVGNFATTRIELQKLDAFVAESKGKKKIPDLFYQFISRNLSAIKTEKDFTKGFLEHFQAMVGYFTFYHPRQ